MITENELKMYLGTKLKVQHKTYSELPGIVMCEMEMIGSELATFSNNCCDYYFNDAEPDCEIQPILYPLSMLNDDVLNEIFKSDGELDIKRLDNVPNQLTIIVSYQQMGETFKDTVCTRNGVEFTPYWIVKKLVDFHFDINNLIGQGKAIAVTNDFNPYR